MAEIDRSWRRGHQQKPPRLRAACDQCNTAKVKCSGERSGCTRCQSLRINCIYGESRVGKVQGTRTRRRRLQVEKGGLGKITQPSSDSIRLHIDGAPEQLGTTADSSLRPTTPVQNIAESINQDLQNWSHDDWTWEDALLPLDTNISVFNDMNNAIGSVSQNPSNAVDIEISSAISVSTDKSRVTSINLGVLGDLTTSAPSSPSVPQRRQPLVSDATVPTDIDSSLTAPASQVPPSPQKTTAKHNLRHNAKLDSKCVLALTEIIATLENYLLSDLRVLDLILSSVHSVISEIRNIVQYQQESRCERCMHLFAIVIDQVATMLEIGSSAIEEAEAAERSLGGGILNGPMNCMQKFGLGTFSSFNAEDQRSWKLQAIRRECQNVREILAQIVALAKLGPNDSFSATPQHVEERAQFFMALQRRLKSLCEKATASN